MAAGLKSRAYLRTVPLYDRVHYNIFFCLCFIVFARTENGSVLLTVRIRRRGEVDVYVLGQGAQSDWQEPDHMYDSGGF